MHAPDDTGGPTGDGEVVVDIEIAEDFSARYSIRGSPEAVIKVAEAIVPKLDPKEQYREQYRRKFFAAAHIFVFGVAVLSVAGMVAHFLDLRKFNLMFLTGMGVWTVGSIIWLYLAIIKDVFGVRVPLRPPPT
jgi:hypothetical protein